METFGTPTRAQHEGWPSIASGRHTLICAPTGTGKTLAAFLAGLDLAWKASGSEGVKILYVSPLKALNSDVAINLELPLTGIVQTAERMGTPLRCLSVGVRTGDTSSSERRDQLKHPPEILITTPESFHLMLTSRQRETLRSVTHVIVDEIHELCSRKRGVSLAVLLERLERLTPRAFLRIGLSATLNPVKEVGAFLGGWRTVSSTTGRRRRVRRPVTIVDAGSSKSIQITVRSVDRAVPNMERNDLEVQLLDVIRDSRSTLIFVNHRAEVERLTNRLNDLNGKQNPPQGGAEVRPMVRSHHGSLSLEQRRATEAALKDGNLSAVVATASLELGIDVGTIDQVCQIGSPGSVARSLQRVGRAGHSVNEVSRAQLFARTDSEHIELVALAEAIRHGAVEPLQIPERCLDVLAQQILACVAVESWEVDSLFELFKHAYPYRNLSREEFDSVLFLLSGRSSSIDIRDLRARLHWNRVANRLEPLPVTRRLAIQGGNTIPDAGQLPVVLEGETRLGELDEDFVMERRVGDIVQLGTSSWMIRSIDPKRVLVSPAEGRPGIVPFWRGEGLGRSSLLGLRIGALRRQIALRAKDENCVEWLSQSLSLDHKLSEKLVAIIREQLDSVGVVPNERQVLVESFFDESKLLSFLIQSPFGRRFHLALKFVLQGFHRDRLGIIPLGYHVDDGLLIQFPEWVSPDWNLFEGITPAQCETILVRELWDSPLFQMRFRQVTNRALPMASATSSVRTPLWFQRHRAETLFKSISVDREHPLFREAIRECLSEDLELAELQSFFLKLNDGFITVESIPLGTPLSPFASELLHQISGRLRSQTQRSLRRRRRYWKDPFREIEHHEPADSEPRIGPIDPDACEQLEARLRGRSSPPRTPEELVELLRYCGDIDEGDYSQAIQPHIEELMDRGMATRIDIAGVELPIRWISTELLPIYVAAFEVDNLGIELDFSKHSQHEPITREVARTQIIRSYFRSHAVVNLDQVAARYGMPLSVAQGIVDHLARTGELVPFRKSPDSGPDRWIERRNFDDLQRITIALRRKESVSVDPETFVDVLVTHHGLDREIRTSGEAIDETLLRRLAGFPAPIEFWDSEVLVRRMGISNPRILDQFLRTEQWHWRCLVEDGGELFLSLVPPDFSGEWGTMKPVSSMSPDAETLLGLLRSKGSLETNELVANSEIDPIRVISAIEELWKHGLIGGDQFDPVRHSSLGRASLVTRAPVSRNSRRSRRPREAIRGGQWESSDVNWLVFAKSDVREPGTNGSIETWASLLLNRYGVLCRETAKLDRWAPAWSELRAALDLAELRGEVRRGYFVSGLSGVQFATESFVEALRQHHVQEQNSRPVLISTIDPANLYGSGAPFAFPLREDLGIRFARSSSNHLVLLHGRPAILSERFARRLTVLPWVEGEEIEKAFGMLSRLVAPGRRVLKINEINGQPALRSNFAGSLLRAGFVRNPPGLAFYAGWSSGPSA
ncbi:DEAD/DEAH box helicase [Tautonia rosea]|uniref:DEAD/DEAH box helicase n=1 Tax=Tautonia rosea TaxID=2728037 RepID=UPI0036F24D3D